MIRYTSENQLPLSGFETPFESMLDDNNRWGDQRKKPKKIKPNSNAKNNNAMTTTFNEYRLKESLAKVRMVMA